VINKRLANKDCAQNVSPDMMSLFIRSKQLNAASDFLFEPAIAPLVEIWGFHDASKMTEQIPDAVAIQESLNKLVSMQNLEYSGNDICPAAPTKIDFGAIGKGWTAAKTIELISEHEIKNILVDFGGDIILKGHNNNNQAWKIGLRDPDQQAPPARIELQTDGDVLAVFTSGDYERMYIQNGQRFHHILDPRTGFPANKIRSVTVVHNDPAKADAAATALFIAGTEWKKIAKSMSIENALVIFPDKQVEITQSLQDKTVWLDTTYQITIIKPQLVEE
jgi:thiamine biosynthesis lipoprotein